MVQSLLEDRFKLVTHLKRREMRGPGARSRPSRRTAGFGSGPHRRVQSRDCKQAPAGFSREVSDSWRGHDERVFIEGIRRPRGSSHIGQSTPVIDATGLTDSFYFTIRSQSAALIGRAANTDSDPPALSTALEEQLGLRLQSRRGPVEVLVIDSAQRPTPD